MLIKGDFSPFLTVKATFTVDHGHYGLDHLSSGKWTINFYVYVHMCI